MGEVEDGAHADEHFDWAFSFLFQFLIIKQN
jgi:hypothetical protein